MSDRASQASEQGGAGNVWSMPNHPVTSPDSDSPKKGQEQALNRACEACRVSKVRCLVNPEAGSTQCQRCAKAGRDCVFAPPAKRRQRKRTDVRVTELEREIQHMRSLLKPSNRSSHEISDHDSSDDQSDEPIPSREKDPSSKKNPASPITNRWEVRLNQPAPVPPPATNAGPRDLMGTDGSDIIDRGIITEDLADELLTLWRNELVIACPGITIPAEWGAKELRAKKPLLFHAVMAACSLSRGSELSDTLHEEAVYLYARSIFIKGEKSMQAIQALLVTVTYYSPPRVPGQLQVYQWVNTAASMALELGLASKPRTYEQLPKRSPRPLQKISSPEELLEHCRTVLLLYTMTAGFSMRFRRPNILLFNSWMEECYNMLRKSTVQDDKRIIENLKLQRIADECYTAFGFDDASTSFSLSELRMQIILRIFDRRMLDWKKSVSDDVLTRKYCYTFERRGFDLTYPVFATMEYHMNMMSMWEFGMDGGRYDVTDFKNRAFTLPALDNDHVQPETLLSRSALQINATTKYISAAQSILDTFVLIPVEKLSKAPNVIFVRALYGLVALMRADYAMSTDADMEEFLETAGLNVEHFLKTFLQRISDAIGPHKCRIPTHWSFVFKEKLGAWWAEYKEWRKREPQMKRRKTLKETDSSSASRNQTPAFAQPKQPDRSSTYPPIPSVEQHTPPQAQLPNYNSISHPYSPWNAAQIPLDGATSAQAMAGRSAYSI